MKVQAQLLLTDVMAWLSLVGEFLVQTPFWWPSAWTGRAPAHLSADGRCFHLEISRKASATFSSAAFGARAADNDDGAVGETGNNAPRCAGGGNLAVTG